MGCRAPGAGGARGQSLAEFALVLPLLLVIFIAVADFGRVFVASITLESATRDAAETVANGYLSTPPGPLDAPATAGGAYYDALRARGSSVVCAEMRSLPNTNYDGATQSCPDMPAVLVCVHDGQDGGCGNPAQPGGGAVDSHCSGILSPPSNAQGGSAARWVEVRTCYHFTGLLNVPLFPLGDVWLQQSRSFTIPCYFVLGSAECG